jgi:DivIVA domain-containing protein
MYQPKGTTMMLTPKEVRAAKLTVHRFREGYDTDEVDDLLDACADTIETLTRVLESIVVAKGNTND